MKLKQLLALLLIQIIAFGGHADEESSRSALAIVCPRQFQSARHIFEAYSEGSVQAASPCFETAKKAYDDCANRPDAVRAITKIAGVSGAFQILAGDLDKASESAKGRAKECLKARADVTKACEQNISELNLAMETNSDEERSLQPDDNGPDLKISEKFLAVRHQLESQIQNTNALRDRSNEALENLSRCYAKISLEAEDLAAKQKQVAIASSSAGRQGISIGSSSSAANAREGVEIGKEVGKEIAKDYGINKGKEIIQDLGQDRTTAKPGAAVESGAGEADSISLSEGAATVSEEASEGILKRFGMALAGVDLGPAAFFFGLTKEAGSSCDSQRSPSELIANSTGCIAETKRATSQLNVGN